MSGGPVHRVLPLAASDCPEGMPTAGRLGLRFEANHGKTIMRVAERRPPLQVVRGFELDDGGSLVHIHNVSGGVLDTDRLELCLDVGSNARVQVTSTGATRIYRSRGSIATQSTRIQIAEGGLLEYLPEPLIPFQGSRFHQTTTVEMKEDAGLFWWETAAPGRQAHGEVFDYQLLQTETEVYALGRAAVIEHVRLEPRLYSIASPLRLGPYRHYSTFYILRIGWPPEQWLQLEASLQTLAARLTKLQRIVWGVSTIAAHGLVIRGLSVTGRGLMSGLLTFWSSAKREIYGRSAVPPRKIW